ncbi:ATP-binding protein [Massilia sp. ST3]|uniref:hybrid sensor histidine kinase/response regulator n=1 Tax=Massilia sp. ST3 TaxID=2824903 RepID=UPI001B846165|nr:ATP-binding protein [Massilia sp. ST3]MBQ5946814.1 response regulator [Massilia sp. ST3]
MTTFQGEDQGSLQRSSHEEAAGAPALALEQLLLRRIEALEADNAVLRAQAERARELDVLVQQLREANGNLVMAAVNAQTLRDDAEETNRHQNEFLAMLAHELRNPLVPISMSANLLDRSSLDGRLGELTKVIQRQVCHMAHLLDDLLDAARLSSGKITLAIQAIDLKDVIAQAVETVQQRMRERGQHFELHSPLDPVVVDGDPVRLAQVFTNLLSNASKYTQDGGAISLSLECGDDVAVTVADNGSGMAPETIAHAFDLFAQGPRTLARSEGGLGVGLNVVRNLVGMHGGSVAASSDGIGAGSSFTVRLPLSRRALPAGPVAAAPAQGGGAQRILVVEDNTDAGDVLRMLLELEGHEVALAADGHAGLAMALDGGYDAIVCDIGLPGIDGYELIARLRADSRGAGPLAVALSGYGHPSDRERAMAAGFDRYLVKPVGPAALLEALDATALQH